MRKELLVSTVIAAVTLFLSATAVGAFDRNDVRDSTRYDVLAERVFTGVVESKAHLLDGLMYFPLRTSRMTLEVQIGPREFVERSGFTLNVGEIVTVVGMPVVVKDRQIILAREIRNNIS